MMFSKQISLVVMVLMALVISVQAAGPRGSDQARLVAAENALSTAQTDIAGLKAGTSLATGAVGSAAILNGSIVNEDVSATAAIAHSKLAVDGIGDVVAAAASATEVAGALTITTITITNAVLTATDTSDEGESVKIFDFDAGAFTLLSAVANLSVVSSAGATNTFYVSVGTVAAADDSDLTSTEADVVARATINTTAGTVLTNAVDAVLASPTALDGTATAKDLYLNLAIDDDNMNADVTNTFSGTITLITVKAVDNQ